MVKKKDESKFERYFASQQNEAGDITAFAICPDHKRAEDWIHSEKSKNGVDADPTTSDNDGEKERDDETEDIEEDSFSTIMENLFSNLSSFYHSISVTHFIKPVILKAIVESQIKSLRDENLVLVQENDDFSVHGIPEEYASVIRRRAKDFGRVQDGMESLPASILMGLVASFDSQISGLIKHILLQKPSMLKEGEKTVDVKEVLSFQNFDDLISNLVDRQIYDLMRGSHHDQVKYIEKNFSIQIGKHFERWGRFLEVFERRNLAAHGEGVANQRYVSNCDRFEVEVEDRIELGKPLRLSPKYLRRSTDVLLEFGILLIWWIWLKHDKQDVEHAYGSIRDVTYDLIVEERYRLASRILTSALSREDQNAPEEARRMMAVNLANCFKKMEDEEGMRDALDKFNWTASADNYKICVAAMKDDIEEVCHLMPRVVEPELVGKKGFRDWPVFDWVREDARFRDKFEEIFDEPIETSTGTATETDTKEQDLGEAESDAKD